MDRLGGLRINLPYIIASVEIKAAFWSEEIKDVGSRWPMGSSLGCLVGIP